MRTRVLIAKRGQGENPTDDKKCRYCHNHTQDISHLLSSCSHPSASLYLPVRHNEQAKVIYNAIISQRRNDHQYVQPRPVWADQDIEIWWDRLIKTVPTVPHNTPDIVVWKKNENKCFIIDICAPLQKNIHKEKIKIDNSTLLTIGLHTLYPNYSYGVVPIVVGATGLITKPLVRYMTKLFNKKTSH